LLLAAHGVEEALSVAEDERVDESVQDDRGFPAGIVERRRDDVLGELVEVVRNAGLVVGLGRPEALIARTSDAHWKFAAHRRTPDERPPWIVLFGSERDGMGTWGRDV
jgi:hypothetical protein